MSNAMNKLKELFAISGVEHKDMSLKDILYSEGKKVGKTDWEIELDIIGFGSKFVQKYYNAETGQLGFHTMLYLADGRSIGAFSNALHIFASFFFQNLGLDPEANVNRAMFTDGDHLRIRVTTVPLDEGKTTYNFEILDGSFGNSVKTINGRSDFMSALNEAEGMIELAETEYETVEENEEQETSEEQAKKKGQKAK